MPFAFEQLRKAKLAEFFETTSEVGWQHIKDMTFSRSETATVELPTPSTSTTCMLRRTARHAATRELIENLEVSRTISSA